MSKISNAGKISWSSLFHRLSPYTIRKGLLYLKHYGPEEFLIRLRDRFEPEEVPYAQWYPEYVNRRQLSRKHVRQKITADAPLISIVVPVFHTPARYLEEMLDSVLAQTCGNWELILVNASQDDPEVNQILQDRSARDARIRVISKEKNEGIAGNTNSGIAAARGVFTGFLDHDDVLEPDTLQYISDAAAGYPDCDLIYTDEDKISQNSAEHFQPNLKSDFNPDLLRSNNYICHFLVVRTCLAKSVGGIRVGFEGAQDYDFILRCTEKSRRIVHIPEILYHWRVHRDSTADNPLSKPEAYLSGKKAIEEHLQRTGIGGTVTETSYPGFYRVRYPLPDQPLVSVIIPNKDQKEHLQTCLDSLLEKTAYPNYEILVIENNSTSEEIFRCYKALSENPRIRLLRWKKPFNYSAINNYGARKAKGEYLLFLNNDTEITSPDWMDEMLSICRRPGTGAVGAKLFYGDGTIQHAGCVIGMGGIAGAMFVGMDGRRSGYLHKASIIQDMSAVTAACMMTPKSLFMKLGGFEEKLAVAFNDMDYCLKVRKADQLVVYDPYVTLNHLESVTRGAEDSKEKVRRFQSEIEYMRSRWTDILKNGDPLYNKNLSLKKWNYSLKPFYGSGEGKES